MDSLSDRLWQTAKLIGSAAATFMPLWIQIMQQVSMVAGWVTTIGGAILTGSAVWRLIKRRWR